ncbi:MAG TPA: 16S rRNA (cytosine(967)-C(5))-methyltransferase RsmB [Ruminococcaceae bacterium]|nr:16S rRNA (cytosine(967)-C(5))-methyltransferase RsmB [Oscillospiraceae bacterium]
MKTARQIAFEALLKIESGKGYSNIVTDSVIVRMTDDKRDAAFAVALTYGVIERQLSLDFIIAANSSKPIRALQRSVLTVLRMGVFQLYFMDSVTPNAAVNESVELIKHAGCAKAAGFVNAVLRACARSFDFEKALSRIDDPIKQMSVRYSCPSWLVQDWMERYGSERTERFLTRSVGKPPLYIRTNTLLIDDDSLIAALEKENMSARKVAFPEHCLVLESGLHPETSECFQKGWFHVQDRASQLCVYYADIRENDTVTDVCSAPGGKAFTAAQYMKDHGTLRAFDLHSNRVRLISEGAERLHIRCLEAQVRDASIADGIGADSDVVLCDTVCSGFGVIRRKPEIKYKSQQEIARLPEIQYQILSTSCRYVKNGGTLMYSTCTVQREENEEVVLRFLEENPDFREEKRLTMFGDEEDSDGFFLCKMRKVR